GFEVFLVEFLGFFLVALFPGSLGFFGDGLGIPFELLVVVGGGFRFSGSALVVRLLIFRSAKALNARCAIGFLVAEFGEIDVRPLPELRPEFSLLLVDGNVWAVDQFPFALMGLTQ